MRGGKPVDDGDAFGADAACLNVGDEALLGCGGGNKCLPCLVALSSFFAFGALRCGEHSSDGDAPSP